MFQLEFFPRTELKTLTDFQKLDSGQLPIVDLKKLITFPEFFQAPKNNEVIKRSHAQTVDSILNLRVKYVEEMLVAEAQGFEPEGSHESWGPTLHEGVQTWVGLEHQTLQTPYSEILRILNLLKLKPYQHIVDLGSAYGRMGIVIGGLFVKNSFHGFEYVKSRVDEGNRVYKKLGLNRSELFANNLFDDSFKLPEADIYFIYDYGQVEHIDKTLRQLFQMANKRPIKLVVRGRFTKEIIQTSHTWLSLQYEGRMQDHLAIYTAYRPL